MATRSTLIPTVNQFIIGDDDKNLLAGLDGNDTIFGMGGNDTINGGGGNDLIIGGNGNDSIDAGVGHDVIYGGNGNDVIYTNAYNGTMAHTLGDTIDGGTGNDYIVSSSGHDLIFGGSGADTIISVYGQDTINGGWGNDKIELAWGDGFLFGDNGDDTIYGGNGSCYIKGGNGHDQIDTGWGLDTVEGGNGNDLIYAQKYGFVIADGGAGNDTISSAIDAFGGTGDDVLVGKSNLYQSEDDAEIRLNGGAGNDKLYTGTVAHNVLIGGSGSDIFIFSFAGTWSGDPVSATVKDFHQSQHDVLNFHEVFDGKMDLTTFLHEYAVQSGQDVVINIDEAPGRTEFNVVLKNVNIANLQASDFIF